MKAAAAVFLGLALFLPCFSFAEHKSAVAGVLIDPNDPGIYGVEEGCPSSHYHGKLNGTDDPDPRGCGHGPVTPIPHDEGDGESIPQAPEEKSLPARFFEWLGSFFSSETKETAKNVLDVAAEANGIPPPGTVSDTVDIVKDATPSIKENIDNIDAYRENVDSDEDTLGIYNDLDDVPENPTLSQRFFRWFNSLIE